MTSYDGRSPTSQHQLLNHNHTELSSIPLAPAKISSHASLSSTPATQASSSQAQLQPYSCLLCKHRKVKCDRINPCANCLKAGAECIYRVPPPPKRRKRMHQGSIERRSAASNEDHNDVLPPGEYVSEREQELLEKVKRYEVLLKDLGALKRSTIGTLDERESNLVLRNRSTPVGDMTTGSADSMSGGDGKLISKYGKSRYLENNLWTSVTNEFQDPKEILEESSEDENENDYDEECETMAGANQEQLHAITQYPADLIFPLKGIDGGPDLSSLHPQPVQIFMLWQAFVDNVNPLVKILHVPTTQKALLDAAANLSRVSKAMEALLFGIYVIAVSSMEEAHCQSTLQENKELALKRFRIGAQSALRGAGILKTSDMMVLQAFALFLLSARLHYDAHSLWSLTGIAIRIGQRIGLHRDGENLKLPVFETEMRRRLWMILVQLDSRAAELSGSGGSIVTQLWDTKPPLNINDCDIHPDMREPPIEQDAATEMMFILLRAQVGVFLKTEMPENNTFDGDWSRLSNPTVSIMGKDRAIDELAQILEEKLVRHCDLQIPLHHISSLLAKAAICKMRLFAHLPRNTRESTSSDSILTSPSLVEENLLFTNSLHILQCDTQIRTTKSLRRFLWHVEMHFQWHALIYLLTYVRTHAKPNSRIDLAWTTIDDIFVTHPEIIYGGRTRSKLCNAVSSLTLKAWEACEIELRRSDLPALLSRPPSCVRQLRGQSIGATAALPPMTSGQAAFIMPLHSVSRPVQTQVQQKYNAGWLQGDGAREFDLNYASGNDNSGPSVVTDAISGTDIDQIDASLIDWGQWDSMCQEFEMQDQWGNPFGSVDALPEQRETYATSMNTSAVGDVEGQL